MSATEESTGSGIVPDSRKDGCENGQALDITVLGLNSGTSMVRITRSWKYSQSLTIEARTALTAPSAGLDSKPRPSLFISSCSNTAKPH